MPEEPYKHQDVPYTAREIREKWHDISNQLSTISTDMSTGFAEMKAKQDTTNGRVKDLEISRAKSEGFYKAAAIFGAAAWAICFAYTGWISVQVLNTKSQIQALDAKLSAYDIKISN